MEPNAKFTVVHCLAPAPFGGLESVVRMLAVGQHTRGHRVVVAVTVDRPEHPFVRSLEGSGVEVVVLVIQSGGYRQERQFVQRLLRDVTPDVVHTHGYRPDLVDLSVAQHEGAGTITTLHGFTGGDWKIRLYERLQLRAIRQADAVVVVSQGVYQRARRGGVPAEKLHLLQNAYTPTVPTLSRDDARQLLGVSLDGVQLGWIGRLSAEKGGDVMVEALNHLQDCPVTLSFIGGGPDQEQLATRAQTLGIADRIRFQGPIENAAKVLRGFDALVLSSRTEGTPMVLLEAMAAGTPIIATSVGGIPDMLSELEATLVPPEDPVALATAIRSLLSDRDAACTRAVRAQERLAKQFGVEPWISHYESLYQTIRR